MKKAVSYFGLIAGAVLLAGSVQAQSGDLSYTYIEGGLSVFDVSGVSEEGFNVRGSSLLTENLYLQGSWDRIDANRGNLDVFKIGLGFRGRMSDSTDWFVEGSYYQVDPDGFGQADDARLDVGLRSALSRHVESRIYAGFLFPDSDEYLFGADLLFKFSDQFGVSVGVDSIEADVNLFRANLRLSF